MPENDQIQPQVWDISQQTIQEISVDKEKKLNKYKKWLNIILSVIFCILWVLIIFTSISEIFEILNSYYSDEYTIREIIEYSEILYLWPLWILCILIWILQIYTKNIDAYYHPSYLTRIISGIFRFFWIIFIYSGLWNFSLIGSEQYSLAKILLIWWCIILQWIRLIFLWKFLYSTKNLINLSISLFSHFIIFVLLRPYISDIFWYDFIEEDFSPLLFLIIFFCWYFFILTIIWLIRCFILKKWWKSFWKILDPTPSSKKISYITIWVLFLILIANLIYGKVQWSKIPYVDESIFNRTEHQTKLTDEEDALIQLKLYETKTYGPDSDKIMMNLESISLILNNYYGSNNEIWRKSHPEECIVVYSWGYEYCGTRAWNEDTLNRRLNSYFIISQKEDYRTNEKTNEYLSIDWEKVTILEYMDTYEPEIRKKFQELDRILSMDYYLPDDEVLDLLPQFFQSWTRSSVSAIRYYIYKEDWDMVMFIIQVNNKMSDITKNIWSVISNLISIVLQWITDNTINESILLLPENIRTKIIEQYDENLWDKNNVIHEMVKWEYVLWNQAKKNLNVIDLEDFKEPSLFVFLSHFPFYSKNNTEKLAHYVYNLMYNLEFEEYYSYTENLCEYYHKIYEYNYFGKLMYCSILPRFTSLNDRIDRNIYRKESLLTNLKSGKYDVWFYERDWESSSYWENYRIPTKEELFENKIKEYSDIVNSCFEKYFIDSDDFEYYYHDKFENTCENSLLNLKNQEKDDFWIKEVLINFTKLFISYDKIKKEVDTCNKEIIISDNCEKIFDRKEKITDKIIENYKKISDISENIKNEFPEIDIKEYFYLYKKTTY